jgi:hypothetical protein
LFLPLQQDYCQKQDGVVSRYQALSDSIARLIAARLARQRRLSR